ncbi:MAG: hypothetical protein MR830_10675 [Succinatimonas sp.]|nr:hypothetical protein [Succinatimonas sp.]MCI6907429.1 hypothetical protein [Succinatimonas sp.]
MTESDLLNTNVSDDTEATSERENKNDSLRIRLTFKQKEKIRTQADDFRMTLTDYVLTKVLDYPAYNKLELDKIDECLKMGCDLARLGNLLKKDGYNVNLAKQIYELKEKFIKFLDQQLGENRDY